MKDSKLLTFLSVSLLCITVVLTGQAQALTIFGYDTSDSYYDITDAIDSGPDNDTASINSYMLTEYGVVEAYKQDVGESEANLPLAPFYDTAFANTETDPEDATITNLIVPPYVAQYLMVKDGDSDPSWYLFDLIELRWNGIDTIQLYDFWVGNGAISHVALYGQAAPVPEPATMLLLGTGLVGLAVTGRKKLKK